MKTDKSNGHISTEKSVDQPSYFLQFLVEDTCRTSPFDQHHAETEIARAHHQKYDLETPKKSSGTLE